MKASASLVSLLFSIFSLCLVHEVQIQAETIALNSEAGSEMLRRSTYKASYPFLRSSYVGQERSMCGPTSVAVVVNALLNRPMRQCRFLEAMENPVGAAKRAGLSPEQIRGEQPRCRNSLLVNEKGMRLADVGTLLGSYGFNAKTVKANESVSAETIASEWKDALQSENKSIVVNFFRPVLGQSGGGHFSIVAAYDQVSERFLIMDVNAKMGSYWVEGTTLISALRKQPGANETRGYVLTSLE